MIHNPKKRKKSSAKLQTNQLDIQLFANAFKALSNPNRLKLYMDILKKEETSFENATQCFLSDIAVSLKINAPTISHHIKELVNANLLTTQKIGKHLVCRVNKDMLHIIKTAFPD